MFREQSGKSPAGVSGKCPQRAQRLKKFNLEMRDWKIQDFNLGMKFSIENGFFNLTPPWLQKNRAWDWNFRSRMKISNQEWKVQARIIFSCVWEWLFSSDRARINFFDLWALWVSDGHRNRKSQKSLRFRCAKSCKPPTCLEAQKW